jgi:hypothetical protein
MPLRSSYRQKLHIRTVLLELQARMVMYGDDGEPPTINHNAINLYAKLCEVLEARRGL